MVIRLPLAGYPRHRVHERVTLLAIVLCVAWISVSIGAASNDLSLPFDLLLARLNQSFDIEAIHNIVMNIRLPRVLMALMIGAALAVSGASLQGVCRNPLADPGLLGISAGAAVGAVTVIVFADDIAIHLAPFVQSFLTPAAAFAGAAITTFTVYRLAQVDGVLQIPTLLLAGVALNSLGGALIGGLSYIADEQALRLITFWMMGSLAGANWLSVCILSPILALTTWAIYRQRHAINLILLGESNARFTGIDVDRVKNRLLWLNALLVGTAVAFSGIIAFIGLVVPHILRVYSDTNYRYLIVNSALLGAALLTLADVTSRMVIAPAEMPIGILTSLIGVPFFIALFMRQKRRTGFGI